jgi:excisionase family DNA binding protein
MSEALGASSHSSQMRRTQLLRGGELLQAYTVEQVAEMLHVGRDKVYYLLRTGQLRSIKIGKLRRITEQHLAEFIASREDVADAS